MVNLDGRQFVSVVYAYEINGKIYLTDEFFEVETADDLNAMIEEFKNKILDDNPSIGRHNLVNGLIINVSGKIEALLNA